MCEAKMRGSSGMVNPIPLADPDCHRHLFLDHPGHRDHELAGGLRHHQRVQSLCAPDRLCPEAPDRAACSAPSGASCPILAALDISPIVLLLGLQFLRYLIVYYSMRHVSGAAPAWPRRPASRPAGDAAARPATSISGLHTAGDGAGVACSSRSRRHRTRAGPTGRYRGAGEGSRACPNRPSASFRARRTATRRSLSTGNIRRRLRH